MLDKNRHKRFLQAVGVTLGVFALPFAVWVFVNMGIGFIVGFLIVLYFAWVLDLDMDNPLVIMTMAACACLCAAKHYQYMNTWGVFPFDWIEYYYGLLFEYLIN